MLLNCLKILTAMCQIDGYVHKPFGDVFCRGLIHKRYVCYISVHSANRRLSFRTYIVSNMTKKYLIRRIPPKNYSYTRMTDN